MYPDELSVKGSTVPVSALISKLHEMKKVGVCSFVPRNTSAPVLAAIFPQLEEFDDDGLQVKPPGLHLVVLPFADDIRDLDFPAKVEVPTDVEDAALGVVNAVRLKEFCPSDFENPKLQKMWSALQVMALDETEMDWVEEEDDDVMPDMEGWKKHDAAVDSFVASFGGCEE